MPTGIAWFLRYVPLYTCYTYLKTNLVTCAWHVSQKPRTSRTQMVDFTHQRASHISKTNFVTCLVFEIRSWHRHIFRSPPQRWPNKPGKNIRPSVHPYVRTSVRTYVHRPTYVHNQTQCSHKPNNGICYGWWDIHDDMTKGHPRSGSRLRETYKFQK